MIHLRTATLADTAAIVAMNADVVAVTSPMDAARFAHLFAICEYCIIAEDGDVPVGFVLAMRDGAAYENGNYDWFLKRLGRFVYIDRIVISEAGRGQGVGGLLYEYVAKVAKESGALVMAAEMDLEPPNIGSLQFHKKIGFNELGSRALDSGKVVSMQVLGL